MSYSARTAEETTTPQYESANPRGNNLLLEIFVWKTKKMFFPEQLPLHLDQTLRYLCSRFSTNQQTTFQPFQTSLINHKQHRSIVVNHLTTINLTKQDLQNAYILPRFIFFLYSLNIVCHNISF